jgi:hypothetical protein
MKRIFMAWIWTAVLIFCCACSGCTKKQEDSKKADCYVINGKTIYFLSNEEKELLREPLIRLLANETYAVYNEESVKGELLGYEIPDPSYPTIPEIYRCGLYDVTGDGLPELLVHPRGYSGSSGAMTYFVYDIMTGNALGEIDSGDRESWCLYYDIQTEALRTIGSYWRRCGWSEQTYRMAILKYCADDEICMTESYLAIDFQIDRPLSSDGVFEELYPNTYYERYGFRVDLNTYYGELEEFYRNDIRISGTELQMTNRINEKDRFVRAEQMADCLLGSSQKFVLPLQ